MYIFSEDQRFVNRILEETSAGGVTINDTMLHHVGEHCCMYFSVGFLVVLWLLGDWCVAYIQHADVTQTHPPPKDPSYLTLRWAAEGPRIRRKFRKTFFCFSSGQTRWILLCPHISK